MLLPIAFQKSALQWLFFVCINYFTEVDDSGDYVHVLPWWICTWQFGKLSFQDVPRRSASAAESFQLGVLCSRSGITLLLLQSTSRSCTSYYAFLLSNKGSTFCYRHTQVWGEGSLCPCVFWWFLARKLSKTLIARVNIVRRQQYKYLKWMGIKQKFMAGFTGIDKNHIWQNYWHCKMLKNPHILLFCTWFTLPHCWRSE